jgi:protein-S-isoprenylcysteine O-methyltransferase Ste14
MLTTVLWVVVGLFPISEIVLAIFKRAGSRSAQNEDRGSLRLLWIGIALGVTCAMVCQWVPSASIRLPSGLIRALALTVIVSGLTIRWSSILTLGRLFTVDVAIRHDHALVQHGLYRLVRHPSYSGLLLAFVGTGLVYENWLSLFGLMVPITLVVINRIAKEERALLEGLGPPYAAYCARTKRLIPGLL